MTQRRSLLLHFLFLLLLTGLFSSCEKFSGDQTIPSYLKVDSIGFSAEYATWGSSSHAICDAWVYVDGELIGAFPLPAQFPVLKKGTHTVKILPGIKKDGIAETRIVYPFYTGIEKQVNLTQDSSISVGTVTSTYDTHTSILWQEDFESSVITLDSTSRSDVMIKKTDPGSPLTFERLHSGIVQMDSVGSFFELISHKAYTIPYSQVFLELNFNTNNQITVSVMLYKNLVRQQFPVMVLLPTNGIWKKIYIDLSNSFASLDGASQFQVMFGNFQDSGVSHAQILLDNIKLVTTK